MTRYLNLTDIKMLNVDINTSCNSACPGCARQIDNLYKNVNVPFNMHMKLDVWKKIIDEIGHQLKQIVFCGNYGDAGATTELPAFIDYAASANSNVHIIVISNMGINSTGFWTDVATIRPNNVLIQCSIDGLEDTNHIYRRFVKWNKVWENVNAVIDAGANAEWKFIEFQWNSHQIETARELSKTAGFKRFIVTPNNDLRKSDDFWNAYNNNRQVWNDATHWRDTHVPKLDYRTLDPHKSRRKIIEQLTPIDSIDCYTKKESSIHVDWYGHVWPCCWYGGIQYSPSPDYLSANSLYTPDLSTGWNNVSMHTLAEILDHRFFKSDLIDSLTTSPNICCYELCGKCNNKYNIINTIGKMEM